MREGAWLINTARAGIVDEPAVLKALDEEHLSAYAADVWEDPRLPDHPKVLATPHIGAQTEEAQREAGLRIVEGVLAALRENCP
jgi:D-3-phosphoglycerate dehydrogenase